MLILQTVLITVVIFIALALFIYALIKVDWLPIVLWTLLVIAVVTVAVYAIVNITLVDYCSSADWVGWICGS